MHRFLIKSKGIAVTLVATYRILEVASRVRKDQIAFLHPNQLVSRKLFITS